MHLSYYISLLILSDAFAVHSLPIARIRLSSFILKPVRLRFRALLEHQRGMLANRQIFLIDFDSASRNKIYRQLIGHGYHAEPFDSLEDFFAREPAQRLVMVHDIGNAIPEFVNRLDEIGEWLPFIAYGKNPIIPQVVNAVRSGAIDYFSLPKELASIPNRFYDLEQMISQKINHGRATARAKKLMRDLTTREMQVLKCISLGMSNRAIAEKYRISPRTVEIHRAKMINKLGVANSPEAAKLAAAAGIAP